MSVSEACETAIRRLALEDEEVRQLLLQAEQEMDDSFRMVEEYTDYAYHESHIASPAKDADPKIIKEAIGMEPPPEGTEARRLWDALIKVRTASMLRGTLTHGKNIAATGTMVGAQRPLEEATAILISRLSGDESRSFRELGAHYRGLKRGSIDAMQMIGGLIDDFKKTGTIDREAFITGLNEKGYPAELVRSKVDAIEDAIKTANVEAFDKATLEQGTSFMAGAVRAITSRLPEGAQKATRFAWNVTSDSPYALLQMEDMVAKMASYRATVEQDLWRQAFAAKKYGESADAFVMLEWGKHADANRFRTAALREEGAKVADNPLSDLAARGVSQAAEDTFTAKVETKLGKMLVNPGIFTDVANIVTPFRSIYVNLHRQAFTKRLAAPFTKQFYKELQSTDPLVRQAALARVAASHVALAAFGTTATVAGMKIWGRDEMDVAQRELMYKTHGKIGMTLQMGDFYYPLDAFPPGIALPLTYYAAFRDEMDEMNYRLSESPESDSASIYAKALGGMVSVVAEQNWVADMTQFIGRTNQAFASGDITHITSYIGQLIVEPMDPLSDIMNNIGMGDTTIRTYDGLLDTIYHRISGSLSSTAPAKVAMGGNEVHRHSKFGFSGPVEYWHGAGPELADFLRGIEYHRVYPSNRKMAISGDAGGDSRMKDNFDTIKLSAEQKNKIMKYAGKTPINGLTLMQRIDQMRRSGELDGLTAHEKRVRVLEVHSEYWNNAKYLMRFDPKERIFERQTEQYVEGLNRANVSQDEIDMIISGKQMEADMTRSLISDQFM